MVSSDIVSWDTLYDNALATYINPRVKTGALDFVIILNRATKKNFK
jgi:hypothetical protein